MANDPVQEARTPTKGACPVCGGEATSRETVSGEDFDDLGWFQMVKIRCRKGHEKTVRHALVSGGFTLSTSTRSASAEQPRAFDGPLSREFDRF